MFVITHPWRLHCRLFPGYDSGVNAYAQPLQLREIEVRWPSVGLVCLLQFWYLVIRCRGKWITGPPPGFCLLMEILELARIFTGGCTVLFSGLGYLLSQKSKWHVLMQGFSTSGLRTPGGPQAGQEKFLKVSCYTDVGITFLLLVLYYLERDHIYTVWHSGWFPHRKWMQAPLWIISNSYRTISVNILATMTSACLIGFEICLSASLLI